MRIARALEAALLVAMVSAGCSGGGDGGGGNGGEPPVADAGSDRTGRLHQPLTLDGTGSADPEGKDLTWSWLLISAPDSSAAVLTSSGSPSAVLTPDVDGTYLVGLTVSDGKSTSALDLAEVVVPVRVGVFGDASRALVSALGLQTSFDADDFTAHPDSTVVTAAGSVVLFLDERTGETSIISHDVTTGIQETIAVGEIEDVVTDGVYVAWVERRTGQWDVFARDFDTGTESQRTNSIAKEGGLDLAGGVLVWEEEVAPSDGDIFAYDFLTGTGYVVASGGVDQYDPRTDGATILFSEGSMIDLYAFDLATMTSIPIAVSPTNIAVATFVSGDNVVYAVGTTAGLALERHRLSDGDKVRVPGPSLPLQVEGDWAIFEGAGGALHAYDLANDLAYDVALTFVGGVDLDGDAVVWSDPTGGGGGDIWIRTLPTGTPSRITDTPDLLESSPTLTQGVVAWTTFGPNGYSDAFQSDDGGSSTTLLSTGKVPFAEALADYDVALFAGDADGDYSRISLDAAIAGGLPVLAAKGSGFGAVDQWELAGDFGLTATDASCGPVAVQFGASHPAFEGFFGGSTAVLDPLGDGADNYYSESFTVAGAEAPADFSPLAYYGGGMCNAGDTAIATFTTPEGTTVIVDGAGGDLLEAGVWSSERLRLFESELRWLASTRAP